MNHNNKTMKIKANASQGAGRLNRLVMPFVTIARDVEHTQSKGCWMCVHARFTAIYFHRPRFPKRWDKWQGIRIEINSGGRGHYRFTLA